MIIPILEMIERLFQILDVLTLHIGCLRCYTSYFFTQPFWALPEKGQVLIYDLLVPSFEYAQGARKSLPADQAEIYTPTLNARF